MFLNLKHILLADVHVATFPLKNEAEIFAKDCGWPLSCVVKAANRFNIFWVVGQLVNTETYRLLQKDKKWIDIKFKGYF